MRLPILGLAAILLAGAAVRGQEGPRPDWARVEEETMRHFQALVRMDTSDPPGNERPAADYLTQLFEKEGIPVQTFTLEPNRTNVVARLKGNGRKRPLLQQRILESELHRFVRFNWDVVNELARAR